MKSTVFSAFCADRELTFLVGKMKDGTNNQNLLPSIFYDTPSNWNSLPAVSFCELKTEDSLFADDMCIGKKYTFRVDIWSSGSTKAISERVDYIMRHLGFLCDSSCDIPDSNIRHRQAIYSILKSV